jgi:transposase
MGMCSACCSDIRFMAIVMALLFQHPNNSQGAVPDNSG